MVKFRKRLIDNRTFEAACICDVNGDGIQDIVCGEFWYEGPYFVKKHRMCKLGYASEYHFDFCDFPLDVNGDGRIDIITGGFTESKLLWRENPGDCGEWKIHLIDEVDAMYIECIECFDIDNCGTPEIFTSLPRGKQYMYKLVKDKDGKGTGKFEKYTIWEGFIWDGKPSSGHGLGFGDMNNDGRADVIVGNGWLERPENPFDGLWTHHPIDFGMALSIPAIAYDVTGNGLLDIIAGNGHGFGLFWFEQIIGTGGERTWEKHVVDDICDHFHCMRLADIDGDGVPELITGKRYRAHNGNDAGEYNPLELCYFKINGGRFTKHTIDYGLAGVASGCGISFWVDDINADGRLDILAPGKDGLYLFENLGDDWDK